jgi:hypothetical protein
MIVPGYPDLLPLHGMVLAELHRAGAGVPRRPHDQLWNQAADDLVKAKLLRQRKGTVYLTDLGAAIFGGGN